MSGRFLRCLVVLGALSLLPWSSAEAAPAGRSLSTSLGPTVAQTLHKLFTVFRLVLQQDQNGNPPNGNPPNGPPNGGGDPSGNSQDGVAIDPHGKPGPRGN